MALRYPVYLNARLAELPDFPENALAVLRLQADGLSNPKIAQRLGMNLETVKYHAKSTYKKLGVSGKAEAVLAARDLGLL
jgi:LuxR family maltose regulon positive regulatory protein